MQLIVCLSLLKEVLKYCAAIVSNSQFYFRQAIFSLEYFLNIFSVKYT